MSRRVLKLVTASTQGQGDSRWVNRSGVDVSHPVVELPGGPLDIHWRCARAPPMRAAAHAPPCIAARNHAAARGWDARS